MSHINELEVTGLDNDNNDDELLTWGARMAIPTTFNDIPHDDVLFYVYLNAWYQYKFEGCRRQIRPLWLHLLSIDGTGGLVRSIIKLGRKKTKLCVSLYFHSSFSPFFIHSVGL